LARLGGPQSWSGRCGEEKNLTPTGNLTLAVNSVAHRYIDWAIPFKVLRYFENVKFVEICNPFENRKLSTI
jgi:hypothetical protein